MAQAISYYYYYTHARSCSPATSTYGQWPWKERISFVAIGLWLSGFSCTFWGKCFLLGGCLSTVCRWVTTMPLGRTSVKASCSPGMTAQHASLLLLLVSVSGIMLPQIGLTPCQGCYLFPLPQDSRVWFCCLCYCSTNVRTISIGQHLMDTNMETKGT
jgi:hypothetical protein